MNILLLCTQSPYDAFSRWDGASVKGGAELSLRLIGEALANRGHAVHFLTRRDLRPVRDRWVDDVRVSHRVFVSVPLLARRSEAFRRVNRRLEVGQWEYHIQRLVRRHGVQLVHSYATYPDTYAAVRVGRREGVPVVQRIAGLFWRMLWDEHPPLRQCILHTFANVTHFLPNSANLGEELAGFAAGQGLDLAGSMTALDIGVDFDRIDAAGGGGDPPGGLDGRPLLLCAASFKARQKRQDILVEALGILRDRGVDVGACLVGGGEMEAAMRGRVARLGLGDRVRFTGNLAHDDVVRLMGRATLYVHPSNFEGLSKSIAEAMYLGLPIVASDVPGIDELLPDGTAVLVGNTPGAFADGIELLLDDPSLARSLGGAARELALERLDPRRNILAYERLFEELVGDR